MLSSTQDHLSESQTETKTNPGVLEHALRIEWLGQTVASLCWFCSVMAYGISSTGDWLQLFAASAWMVANIAALFSTGPETPEPPLH